MSSQCKCLCDMSGETLRLMMICLTVVCVQVVGTALLLLGVSAVGHNNNSKISSVIGPLLVAFLVMAIGICFGHNAG